MEGVLDYITSQQIIKTFMIMIYGSALLLQKGC